LKQENRIEVLKKIAVKGPRLELKVLSSAFLEKGEIININPIGLEGDRSLRKTYDGFTYFGCKKINKKVKPYTVLKFPEFGLSQHCPFLNGSNWSKH